MICNMYYFRRIIIILLLPAYQDIIFFVYLLCSMYSIISSQCGNFEKVSVTHILREINFWSNGSYKFCHFYNFRDLDFNFGQFLQFIMAELYYNQDTDSLKSSKWHFLRLSFVKIWFHVKSDGKEFLKFPHFSFDDSKDFLWIHEIFLISYLDEMK